MFKYLVILVFIAGGRSLPNGAPATVCQTMAPFHGGGIAAQSAPSPFTIQPAGTKSPEDTRLRITIGSRDTPKFKGFMMQARDVTNGNPIGSFVSDVSEKDTKLLQCSGPGDTVTHSNPEKKGPLDFYWEPPQGFLGEVIFKYVENLYCEIKKPGAFSRYNH